MRSFDAMKNLLGRVGSTTLASVVVLAAGSVGAAPAERSAGVLDGLLGSSAMDWSAMRLNGVEPVIGDDDEWAEEFYHLLMILCILIDCMAAAPEGSGPEMQAQAYIQAYEVHGVSTNLTDQQVLEGIHNVDITIQFLSNPGPQSLTPGTRSQMLEVLRAIRGELIQRN